MSTDPRLFECTTKTRAKLHLAVVADSAKTLCGLTGHSAALVTDGLKLCGQCDVSRDRMLVGYEVRERFAAGYRVDPTGCWIWQGSVNGSGYGTFGIRHHRVVGAHVASYILHRGEVPEGLQLDHLCSVARCVNPEHLEPVTIQENNRRKWERRPPRRPTHCPRGHEYTDANTYRRPNGVQVCRTCGREWARKKPKEAGHAA